MYDPTHGKSGYIGRKTGNMTNPNEVQFLLDKKTKLERIFENRESAISYLRIREHLAKDDLLHMLWFSNGEDEQRNLFTGELIKGVEVVGDVALASNFWMCGTCGKLYRKIENPYCPDCSGCDHCDNPDATVEDVLNRCSELLTKEEREILSRVYREQVSSFGTWSDREEEEDAPI